MNINNLAKLITSVAISELAGVVGAVFTSSAIQSGWYDALAKPALNPPSWIFAPAWTILYAIMGVSTWLVWRKLDSGSEAGMTKKIKIALGVFGIQLVLNAAWSIIFFGFRNTGWAFVNIVTLWWAIVFTIIYFSKISRLAALLLLPYIVWVSFAGYLNYSIWRLNSSMDSDSGQTMQIGNAPATEGDSGIRGVALLGQTCPVERIPPDPRCADRPYKTDLELTAADQSRVIRTLASNSDGKFEVDAGPGEYAIRNGASANILPRCASRETIKVTAGSYTETTVYCDTGIR